ncbi:M20/M25/M40 family metallo-hydrolase [Sciscionella sediminilitoris]|uniref:M20/M25/M40 family metallo-hydrolase n=1 Tax=Sciscionella sediminilitoris TaxID=1445613 RepID=UPI0004DEEAFA|nr:M20/M25/M40 family metallo-hydrolase [Sciscionella sp. SE31]
MTDAESEVVDLCRDLLRIDSSNPTSDERATAEYVAEKLADAGIEPEIVESEPGRASVFGRIEGRDPGRGALLLHGHLDVVPADPAEWTVHPFSGEIREDCLWGRGAIDMKDFDAVTLATARELARTGEKPARDIVFGYLADEEGGGRLGSHWLVRNRPDLFDGVTEAITEGGGVSFELGEGKRLYPIECAQRGQAWLRLIATGRAGHGSSPNDENAVTDLAESLARIGRHRFPVRLIEPVRVLLEKAAELLGVEFDADDVPASLERMPQVAPLVEVILRNSANPTMIEGGYQTNVIPGTASAAVDGRFLPGGEQELLDTIDSLLLPSVRREFIHRDVAMETEFTGDLVDAMCAAIQQEDPEGHPAPYCNAGGTDNKAMATIGIKGFGFKALRVPPELPYSRMFHGVDERIPLESLRFATRVFGRLVRG